MIPSSISEFPQNVCFVSESSNVDLLQTSLPSLGDKANSYLSQYLTSKLIRTEPA